MNFNSVLVAAAREICGSGKTAPQIAGELALTIRTPNTPESNAVRALFTSDRDGSHPTPEAIANRLDALEGKADSQGGVLTITRGPGARVYSVV